MVDDEKSCYHQNVTQQRQVNSGVGSSLFSALYLRVALVMFSRVIALLTTEHVSIVSYYERRGY